MSIRSATPTIKRERKKAQYLRELAVFVDTLAQEQPTLREVYVSRIDLSADGGICYVYFALITPVGEVPPEGEQRFDQALEVLKLYKPSLRKALAGTLQARYTPDLHFLFDETREKVDRINSLLDQVRLEFETVVAQEE